MSDLGRIKLHDPKSRQYEYPVRRAERGVSVRHRFSARHVDQFFTSGCVGFSGTNMLNTAMAVRSRVAFNKRVLHGSAGRTYLGNDDGLTNYSESTKRDPFDWVYPPTDEGSSALGLMKWWKELGVITRYEWAFTFNQFIAALQRQPVLVGTWWYEGMSEPDQNGIAHISGARQGGHEYLATGVLWSKRLIEFQQSWGTDIAFPTFFMSWEDAEASILDDGDVAVPTFL